MENDGNETPNIEIATHQEVEVGHRLVEPPDQIRWSRLADEYQS